MRRNAQDGGGACGRTQDSGLRHHQLSSVDLTEAEKNRGGEKGQITADVLMRS